MAKIISATGIASESFSLKMKYSRYLLFAFLFIIMILGATIKLSSQEIQSDNKLKIADSISTTTHKSPGYVKGITSARAISLVEGLLGLMSIIIGWRAKARFKKSGARIGLVLGLLAITLSIGHLALTAGSVFGSGSGKAGAILALILGIAGCMLGRNAFRSRLSNSP